MEAESEAQVEARSTPQALSLGEALIGMLLMLDPALVFSEDSLRKFLREQNHWQPCFENLFRTRLSVCSHKANNNRLCILRGLLLVDDGQNFRVRQSIRETALDQLEKHGILPACEEQLKAEAERFTTFVRHGQQ